MPSADLLKTGAGEYKSRDRDLARSEEDVLSYALFPAVARDFFERRLAKERGIPDDELLAVIAAAVRAYAKQDPHPLIRNTVDTPEHRVHFNVINPTIRSCK